MSVREGRWMCACTRENLGRFEACQGCGRPRPTGVQFYLPGDAPVITEPALLAQAAMGPDWYCDHCGGANPDMEKGRPTTNCRGCGQARDERDDVHQVRTYGSGAVPTTHEAANPRRPDRPRRRTALAPFSLRRQPREESTARSTLKFVAFAALIALGVALVSAIVASFTFPWGETRATVTGVYWQRGVVLEALRTERDGGWSLPIDARLVSTERRQSGTTRVQTGTRRDPCGQIDKGNGFFETRYCSVPVYREDPVYSTWYHYDIERWRPTRTPSAKGEDHAPYWPDFSMRTGERERGRRETYGLVLRLPDDAVLRRNLPRKAWREMDAGDQVPISTNFWGQPLGILRLEDLAQQ